MKHLAALAFAAALLPLGSHAAELTLALLFVLAAAFERGLIADYEALVAQLIAGLTAGAVK